MPLKTLLTDSVTRLDLALGKGMNRLHAISRANNVSGSIGRLLSKCLRDLRFSIAGYHLEKGISIQFQIKALILTLQSLRIFVAQSLSRGQTNKLSKRAWYCPELTPGIVAVQGYNRGNQKDLGLVPWRRGTITYYHIVR